MKIKYFFLAAAMTVAFGACSSDSDNETVPPETNGGDDATEEVSDLGTPKYAGISARYDITDASSDIRSIELTESGEYIIVEGEVAKDALAAPTAPAKASIIPLKPAQTRAGSGFLEMARREQRHSALFMELRKYV